MFEDLNKKIRLDNLQKIRQLNGMQNKSKSEDIIQNSDDQLSLSDLDIELEEREKNFNKIMSIADDFNDNGFILKRNDSINTPPRYLRKIKNQLQLTYQKIRLQEDSHKKQLHTVNQIHLRQKQFFQCQIQKLKMQLKSQKKGKDDIKRLRKQNDNLLQINQMLEIKCNTYQQKIRVFGLKIQNLQGKLNKIQDQQNMHDNKHQQQNEISHQYINKIDKLKQQLDHVKKRLDKKQTQNQKQNMDIKSLQDTLKNQREVHMQILNSLKNQYQTKFQILQKQSQNLHQRNQHLQEVFLDKIAEITKLQATFFTANQSNTHNRGSFEQTISLHEQSPIRPHKVNTQERNSFQKRQTRIYSTKQQINNPQKNVYNKNNQVSVTNERLKQKLSYANKKIVQLLGDKIKNQKKFLEITKQAYK